jgi:poly-gamma-glutamate synthesis protein (capsule biosynthesis protein)
MMEKKRRSDNLLRIFLCGDVMTGRGIDQILPYPSDAALHEPYVRNAKEYIKLAQLVSHGFSYPVEFSYIWGDALQEFDRRSPDLKIINLETSITASQDFLITKGIHYKMNPLNISALTAAGIDGCALANNHILDWGEPGLRETLLTLRSNGLKSAGAGEDLQQASAPAVFEMQGKPKVFLFSYGSESSGIPRSWSASNSKPGVNLLDDLSPRTVQKIKENIQSAAEQNDFVILSIHWGDNWSYQIHSDEIEFAHRLIDEAGVSVVHGHSSHHAKGIEVYENKLVLYGCGDFLTDYEGISGYEEFRGDLSLMYFASFDPVRGDLVELEMVPVKMHKFRVVRSSQEDQECLKSILIREGQKFGTSVDFFKENNSFLLRWNQNRMPQEKDSGI